jgi:acetyl esterase
MTTAAETRHLVDPELFPLIELLSLGDLDPALLAVARSGAQSRAADVPPPPIAPTRVTIPGPGGALEVYCYDPAPGATGRAALLHIHGGGMVIGSARDMVHGPSLLAAKLGIPVASVEYRLAPETPFPGPQEDCLAALQWLAGSGAAGLGVDPSRIAVIGESAGGGLAAATALMARDNGGPPLAAQILVYPMLDHRTGGAGCPYRNRSTGEFIWSRTSNQFGWAALRGSYAADDHRKGWFSPSLADDLAGLPPTLILTGSLDLFFDEDLDFARRLVDAGVPVELHSYPGAVHGFDLLPGTALGTAFTRDLLGGTARLLGLACGR